VATPTPAAVRSSARRPLAERTHGIAGGVVRFGVATWFHDVLVRFGYDLFEHEHPWDGEWIDDAFEAAALDLRATGSKLLRALDRLHDDPETGPLSVDLAVAYLERMLGDLAVVIPNCHGVEGRSMPRGDLAALGFAVPVDLSFATHARDLYMVVDASVTPALPKAHARLRTQSQAITRVAISELEEALRELCPWFDGVLDAMQHAIAARAEDGDALLERWANPDWSVLGPATPNLERRLPCLG
jgi:hypothetical protein